MKPVLSISIPLDPYSDHMSMLECYMLSSSALYASSLDGIVANKNNPIGFPPDEFHYRNFFTAFALLRHSLELAIKAFICELTGNDKVATRHDVKELWEMHRSALGKFDILSTCVFKAFSVLEKFDFLKNDQLLRYHCLAGGQKRESALFICSEDYETVYAALCAIHGAIFVCKQDAPLREAI